jgi:hypothetical protein
VKAALLPQLRREEAAGRAVAVLTAAGASPDSRRERTLRIQVAASNTTTLRMGAKKVDPAQAALLGLSRRLG